MTYNPLYQELEQQASRIARFLPAAFHIHSIGSHDWASRSVADKSRNDAEQFKGIQGVELFLDELAREFDVVCITDHMKVQYACDLSKASLHRNDILVLPGMEVNCTIPPFLACIHLLVIFPPNKDAATIERIFAGNGGFPAEANRNGTERFEIRTGLDTWVSAVEQEGGIVIVAHIDGDNGHRQVIQGGVKNTLMSFLLDRDGIQLEEKRAVSEEYANVLVRSGVHAVEIMKPADRRHYVSLEYGDNQVCRIPCVMRSDAHCIEDLARKECKTHIKVARKDFAAVKDALNFFETRIRFQDTVYDRPTSRIVGLKLISPENEGLFDEAIVAFSQNLNCIIGSRGSGKSTLIEAVRYGMGANHPCDSSIDGNQEIAFASIARKIQAANLKGTIIQIVYETSEDEIVVLSSTYDGKAECTTEVFDLAGNALNVSRHDLAAKYPLRIYSWSEIETLGRRPELQRQLIDCLIPGLAEETERREELYRQLSANRRAMATKSTELQNKLEDDKGLVRRFSEYSSDFELVNTEEVASLFENLDAARQQSELLAATRDTLTALVNQLRGVDLTLLSEQSLTAQYESLHGWWASTVAPRLLTDELQDEVGTILNQILQKFETRVAVLDDLIGIQQAAIQSNEQYLREKTQASPDDDLKRGRREQSKQRFDACALKRDQYLALWSAFEELLSNRNVLIAQLETVQERISNLRAESQKAITAKLDKLQQTGLNITVSFQPGSDRDRAITFMRETSFLSREFSGQYRENKFAERCLNMATPTKIAAYILSNTHESFADEKQSFGSSDKLKKAEAKALVERYYPLSEEPSAQVTVVDLPKLESIMDLQEQRWDDRMRILLDGKPVDDLSPGQRSSAMLPLIALSETVPLIIDQPEDNLDNRILGNVLTTVLADLKEKRQIIVVTHNPNIVVGGDAEQVVVLNPAETRKCRVAHTASIDDPITIEAVLTIMEGGREAFETRGRRYKTYLS